MYRIISIVAVVVAVVAVTLILTTLKTDSASAQSRGGLEFDVGLSGAQEVPEVLTETSGGLNITFSRDLSSAEFRLHVFNGVEVIQAHLHCTIAGQNGPVVAFLFGPENPPVDVNGLIAMGTLTNNDIIPLDCGLPVNNIASLAMAVDENLIYANVHTAANPGGEVRGQLFD